MIKDPHVLHLQALEQESELREALIKSGEQEDRLARIAHTMEEQYRKSPSQADRDAFERIWAASEQDPQPGAARPLAQPSASRPSVAATGGSASGSRGWAGRNVAAVGGVKRGK